MSGPTPSQAIWSVALLVLVAAVTTASANGVSHRGDMNCDGAVDRNDIQPFLLAVNNPAGYMATYPNCDIMNGDINGDMVVNALDIQPFFALFPAPVPVVPAAGLAALTALLLLVAFARLRTRGRFFRAA